MRQCLPNPTKITYIRFFFLQVKTELMTQGGAQCGGLHSQTKTHFQPSAAWPRRPPARPGKEAASPERFLSEPGAKAAANISTEGDPSGKIFFEIIKIT